MAKIKTRTGVETRKVVELKQWIINSQKFLQEEKNFTKARDKLNEKRRRLPWLKVNKNYVFDGPNGRQTLAQLFKGKKQLLVYHFMFAPEWKVGCPHCSFWADSFQGNDIHLKQKDTSFILISRAPIKKINQFKKRMGWTLPWYSSFGSDFSFDFRASFTKEEVEKGKAFFNFEMIDPGVSEREGISAFYRDGKNIYLTYQSFARGIDLLNSAYNMLDLTALGRNEDPDNTQEWVKFHDQY